MSRNKSFVGIILALTIPIAIIGLMFALMGSGRAEARNEEQPHAQETEQAETLKEGMVEYTAGRVMVKFRSEVEVTKERDRLRTGRPQVDSLLTEQGVSEMRPLFRSGESEKEAQNESCPASTCWNWEKVEMCS
jgi:hypothetical protein